ncbi:MAG: hypothetical protein II920_00160 [Clostridia bacterium]|nr:hypothetical protein [Clostridia bacterium]
MKTDEQLTAGKLLQSYKTLFTETYALCFAITGDETSAQYALMDAMVASGAGASKQRLREQAIKASLSRECEADSGYVWLDDVPQAPTLSGEDAGARRAAVLIYGCKVSLADASKVLGTRQANLKAALAETLAAVPGASEAKRKKNLQRICINELRLFPYSPDTSAFRRALENRLSREREKTEIAAGGHRLLSGIAALVMLLLIGFMLWTGAVLLNYFRDSAQNNAEEVNVSVQGID